MKSEKNKPTFEEAMTRLEEIVGLLETGGAPLDETMTLYAEGAKLASICSEKLQKAEQTVTRVAGEKVNKKDETKDA
jgi:exodeoxyribonuclease VII small subunit